MSILKKTGKPATDDRPTWRPSRKAVAGQRRSAFMKWFGIPVVGLGVFSATYLRAHPEHLKDFPRLYAIATSFSAGQTVPVATIDPLKKIGIDSRKWRFIVDDDHTVTQAMVDKKEVAVTGYKNFIRHHKHNYLQDEFYSCYILTTGTGELIEKKEIRYHDDKTLEFEQQLDPNEQMRPNPNACRKLGNYNGAAYNKATKIVSEYGVIKAVENGKIIWLQDTELGADLPNGCVDLSVLGAYSIQTRGTGVFFHPDKDFLIAQLGGRVEAIEKESGRVRWKYAHLVKTSNVPAISGNLVFVGFENNDFIGFDTKTGEGVFGFNAAELIEGREFHLAGADSTRFYLASEKEIAAFEIPGSAIVPPNPPLRLPDMGRAGDAGSSQKERTGHGEKGGSIRSRPARPGNAGKDGGVARGVPAGDSNGHGNPGAREDSGMPPSRRSGPRYREARGVPISRELRELSPNMQE